MKKYLFEQLDVQTITNQKDFTYYRYKFLSKILIGKKRLKYEKKYQKLKQAIKSIKK